MNTPAHSLKSPEDNNQQKLVGNRLRVFADFHLSLNQNSPKKTYCNQSAIFTLNKNQTWDVNNGALVQN